MRRDRLAIERSELDQDKLNELAGKTLPDIMAAAIQGTNQAYAEDRRPTADIRLPGLDEFSMGQFFQMMMLATVVEGRLIGINPYGQPRNTCRRICGSEFAVPREGDREMRWG